MHSMPKRLGVVFVKCSHSSCGAGFCSARRELHEVVVNNIVCVGNLALLGHYRTTVVVLAPGMVGGFKVLY